VAPSPPFSLAHSSSLPSYPIEQLLFASRIDRVQTLHPRKLLTATRPPFSQVEKCGPLSTFLPFFPTVFRHPLRVERCSPIHPSIPCQLSFFAFPILAPLPQVEKCGPLSTFLKLRTRWNDGRTLTPSIRAKGEAAPRTFDEQVR
jgi:hypothetical protein